MSAPEQSVVVKNIAVTKPLELSKAQMEVLSIVAYRQPITRLEIDEIRGVDSSFAVKRLMQIKLIKILGKSEGLGRPLLYGKQYVGLCPSLTSTRSFSVLLIFLLLLVLTKLFCRSSKHLFLRWAPYKGSNLV